MIDERDGAGLVMRRGHIIAACSLAFIRAGGKQRIERQAGD
jgi:hypothetical protein